MLGGVREWRRAGAHMGGLLGGIAVALSLPANEFRPFILSITYVVVLFSIVVQGLTVTRLIRRVIRT